MRTFLLISLLILPQQAPKNNPNGIWSAESGSEFEFTLIGNDIKVLIVPGSSPRFVKYQMDLKGTDEPNTYQGAGHFKAKFDNGRECEFDTQWQIVIVSDNTIIGVASEIVPDPDTCEIVQTNEVGVQMVRKQ